MRARGVSEPVAGAVGGAGLYGVSVRGLPGGTPRRVGAWRAVMALAAVVVLSSIALAGAGRLGTGGSVAGVKPARAGFATLPWAARGPVSAALGRDDRAYWVHGLSARNPEQDLGVAFSRSGVRVTSARGAASLSLAPFGHADALRRTVPVRSGHRPGPDPADAAAPARPSGWRSTGARAWPG
jgi:hypothetical protein